MYMMMEWMGNDGVFFLISICRRRQGVLIKIASLEISSTAIDKTCITLC
jgi:hypothetical protein